MPRETHPSPVLLTIPVEIRMEIYRLLLLLPPHSHNPKPSRYDYKNYSYRALDLQQKKNTIPASFLLSSRSPPSPSTSCSPSLTDSDSNSDPESEPTQTQVLVQLQSQGQKQKKEQLLHPAILSVCSQTHAEASDILYRANSFLADSALLCNLPRLREWYPPVTGVGLGKRIRRWYVFFSSFISLPPAPLHIHTWHIHGTHMQTKRRTGIYASEWYTRPGHKLTSETMKGTSASASTHLPPGPLLPSPRPSPTQTSSSSTSGRPPLWAVSVPMPCAGSSVFAACAR